MVGTAYALQKLVHFPSLHEPSPTQFQIFKTWQAQEGLFDIEIIIIALLEIHLVQLHSRHRLNSVPYSQGLINGLTPNLIGLATQIAPTARDPSLGVQHAVPQAVNQQVPMQLYSGHAVQENASFIGYLQQQPISAAIAELPALTGGQSPMASAGAQEGSKQPVLPGHSSTGGQHPMQSDSEERRKNPTPQVRWVWSPPASQIGSRIVFRMKQIASPFLRR